LSNFSRELLFKFKNQTKEYLQSFLYKPNREVKYYAVSKSRLNKYSLYKLVVVFS